VYCCLIAVLLLVFGSPAKGQTPLPVDVHVDPGCAADHPRSDWAGTASRSGIRRARSVGDTPGRYPGRYPGLRQGADGGCVAWSGTASELTIWTTSLRVRGLTRARHTSGIAPRRSGQGDCGSAGRAPVPEAAEPERVQPPGQGHRAADGGGAAVAGRGHAGQRGAATADGRHARSVRRLRGQREALGPVRLPQGPGQTRASASDVPDAAHPSDPRS
jgi:hypothetical protein